RRLDDLAKTVGQVLGFNTVRMPFSVEGVLRNPRIFSGLDANPDLQGLRVRELMHAVIGALAAENVRTVPDCHRSSAGRTGGSTKDNGLWYDSRFGPNDWLDCWQGVAQEFAGDDAVIGFDLF